MRQGKDTRWILYVEDDPDDAALTARAFREIGFTPAVVHLADGAKALDFLLARNEFFSRKRHDTPNLVLLDLKLPKVSGMQVLQELRRDPLLKHLVVVVLTSSRQERDRLEAEVHGANLFVQKPIDFDEFIEVARRIDGMVAAVSG